MAESSFRSKFAGMPGSLMAIRVNYDESANAFDAPAPDSKLTDTRRQVRRWKYGHRLGDQQDWNSSSRDDATMRFPDRAMMHTTSEYQAIKINYNFRSSTLPDISKSTQFFPKPSKMQVDKTIFLSQKEKEKVVGKCPATVTNLSCFEMKHQLPGTEREAGWNCSTEMSKERSDIFKRPQLDSYTLINKTKNIVDPDTYRSPLHLQREFNKKKREDKVVDREHKKTWEHREREQRRFSEDKRVFKMSNINDWWERRPQDIEDEINNLTLQRKVGGAAGGGAASGAAGGPAGGARQGQDGGLGEGSITSRDDNAGKGLVGDPGTE